jgi:ABC-type Fe3+/spermidine/putrescine transport system ATPase subunit
VRALDGSGGMIEIAPGLTVEVSSLQGFVAGDAVDVAIRPESIRLAAAAGAPGANTARISNHVFLGNISEYYATLPAGLTLRVQTHPLQRFEIGEHAAVEIDATQCSVFRADAQEDKAA